MNRLTATFRIVTPMFLGGAEPTRQAELRVPSIKGALRFWWRALMWWHGIHETSDLKKQEDALFGCSDSRIGQSQFLLRIEAPAKASALNVGMILSKNGKREGNSQDVVGEGARYLGYGLMGAFGEKGGKLTRSCLLAPSEFLLHVHFKPEASQADCQQIQDALKLLGLCGGLGSRARRGFGSLSLVSLTRDGAVVWTAPSIAQEWERELRSALGHLSESSGIAEWTGFCRGQSKALLLSSSATSPLEMLGQMGRDFTFFRSWGRNGKVLGLDSEKLFQDDHDLMKTPAGSRNHHPRRIAFGLPHNYGKDAEQQVAPADKDYDRRASALFFHIHQPSAQRSPLGVLLYLPSRFLSLNRDKISVGGKNVPLVHQGDGDFWKPVHEFLERLRSGSGKERFTETLPIQL